MIRVAGLGVIALSLALAMGACNSPTETMPDPDTDGDGWVEDDCDPDDEGVHPEATEVPYDGIDQDCDGQDLTDADGDGWDAVEVGGDDCDDAEPDVNPVAEEEPYDGLDNDCLDGDLTDQDGDGYDAEEISGEDCNDRDADEHPGVLDDCGGRDEDCDGVQDEDEDQDGDGYSSCAGDCDDLDALANPDAEEVAQDEIDQNCNGVDQGDCPEEILSEPFSFEFTAYLYDCEFDDGGDSAYEHFTDYGLVPEDANCNGTDSGTWTDTYSGDNATITVSMSVSFVTGSGSFSGEGSYDGTHCDDVSGTVEVE
ncbi:MAG: hypothetical protein L6Q80_10220 [Dehalococcoidia bacterium]|nr:hypothetical protein [Dehalococcoidia bacterium]